VCAHGESQERGTTKALGHFALKSRERQKRSCTTKAERLQFTKAGKNGFSLFRGNQGTRGLRGHCVPGFQRDGKKGSWRECWSEKKERNCTSGKRFHVFRPLRKKGGTEVSSEPKIRHNRPRKREGTQRADSAEFRRRATGETLGERSLCRRGKGKSEMPVSR